MAGAMGCGADGPCAERSVGSTECTGGSAGCPDADFVGGPQSLPAIP
jgi:hypothetical protein